MESSSALNSQGDFNNTNEKIVLKTSESQRAKIKSIVIK